MAAVALATAAMFAFAIPANASTPPIVTDPTSKTTTYEAEECLAAVAVARSQGAEVAGIDCTITTVSTTTEAEVVTADQLRAETGLSAADKSSLLDAAARATIYSKHFSWFTTGGAYTVTHDGTFYYDGTRAWVTVPYSGYTGFHNCFTNYAAGLSIANEACTDTGGTSSRTLYFQWRVTWIVPPYTGLSYSVSNTGYVYADGTTS
jgi:hypothetical protein